MSGCGGSTPTSSPVPAKAVTATETVTVSKTETVSSSVPGPTSVRPRSSGVASPTRSGRKKFCWPSVSLPAVRLAAVHLPATTLPATHLPATTIPRTCFGGTCSPAQTIPAQNIPGQTIPAQNIAGQTIPAQRIPGGCLPVANGFAPQDTTVRVSHYEQIDPQFDGAESTDYWSSIGQNVSVPDVTAAGFGELNGAGFPKNQYVRPYFRRDGTYVSGYWRNSPTDGLPTCRIIRC